MPTVSVQNQQIITTLCGRSMRLPHLLSALQSAYPSASWTRVRLRTRLTNGRKRGRFQRVTSNTGYTAWVNNQQMAGVNYPVNTSYLPYCTQLYPPWPVELRG